MGLMIAAIVIAIFLPLALSDHQLQKERERCYEDGGVMVDGLCKPDNSEDWPYEGADGSE